MISATEVAARIQTLLASTPGGGLTEMAVRRAARECRDEMYADNVAHGGTAADPFVDFVVLGRVAVFAFFADPFEIYVVPCDEGSLIADFESANYSMSDLEAHRRHLREKYGKEHADVTMDRTVAEYWMEMS